MGPGHYQHFKTICYISIQYLKICHNVSFGVDVFVPQLGHKNGGPMHSQSGEPEQPSLSLLSMRCNILLIKLSGMVKVYIGELSSIQFIKQLTNQQWV